MQEEQLLKEDEIAEIVIDFESVSDVVDIAV